MVFLFPYFLCCHRGCSNSLMVVPGVSIKIEVATGLDRVTDCTNKGLLVPLFYKGGGRGRSKCIPPQKILNFKALKCNFSAFWMRGQQTCTLTIYFNMWTVSSDISLFSQAKHWQPYYEFVTKENNIETRTNHFTSLLSFYGQMKVREVHERINVMY